MTSRSFYIGLMSGTSIDGVDAVLADFSVPSRPNIVASTSLPMPALLRQEFLGLNIAGINELSRAALAANELARLYAQACEQVLVQANLTAQDIIAVGAHGQTVRHEPHAGFSIQINAPALLADLTGIDVIADFRSRDVAAGGQGAPLVPAFHSAIFSCEHPRAVLNLGGIANVTLLHPNKPVRGFDTGPANVLLDLWCHAKNGLAYDHSGSWAASGHAVPALLDGFIETEPWFRHEPPKSTGRDRFNWKWLNERLAQFADVQLKDNDVQATLQSLTARTIADAIKKHAPETQDVLVCGGGAFNHSLVQEIEFEVQRTVVPTSVLHVPVQLVEALAFAWLAWAHVNRHPAGLPSVTGARKANILGCQYPG